MVPREYLGVLRVLLDRLDKEVPWVITGSLGFALQGLDCEPHDVDLQTDEAGAYAIERALAEYMVTPVRFRESGRIRSHFGTASVHGIAVEIIGDIQKLTPDGRWTAPPDLAQHRRWVHMAGMELPVLSLEYEYEAYRAIRAA